MKKETITIEIDKDLAERSAITSSTPLLVVVKDDLLIIKARTYLTKTACISLKNSGDNDE